MLNGAARARVALADAAMVGRLTRDLPPFLRSPLTLERAAAEVQRRLQTRTSRFLELVERVVYANPRSPYRRLLHSVGCELGDLRQVVAAEGLEAALGQLVSAGMYVTFDELKGRVDAVRGSERFRFRESDFDNFHLAPHVGNQTGGTGGSPSRVTRSLRDMEMLSLDMALTLEAHGVRSPEHVFWLPAPLLHFLVYAKLGHGLAAWFCPLPRLPLRVLAGARFLAALSHVGGHPFPLPRAVSLQSADSIAIWLGRRLESVRPICVSATVSGAVRISVAAWERGISLAGVYFLAGSEPMTPARHRTIGSVGARSIVKYGLMEAGLVGAGCGEGRDPDDLHVFGDRFAIIQRSRKAPDSETAVDAFLVTTLDVFAPKVLINVETGDYGELERRRCACTLGEIGFSQHISHVRSFEKMTGEGVTFVRTNLVRVLEEVLPARFGGSSTDYQLVEQEQADGGITTALIVSPRAGQIDELELRNAFLEAVGRDGELEGHHVQLWRDVGAPTIKRQEPLATGAGKVFPFQRVKSTLTRQNSGR